MAKRSQSGLNMAATVPSWHAKQGARLAIVLLLVSGALIAWNVRVRIGEVAPFLPMYAMATFVADGLTAYLLSLQFLNSRQVSVGVVAAGYGFCAPIPLLQLLAFPGVFAPAGLIPGGTQVAVWMWLLWHSMYPTFIIAALVYEARYGDRTLARKTFFYASRFLFVVPTLGSLLLCGVLMAVGPQLPALISAGRYTDLWKTVPGIYAFFAHALALLLVVVLGRWRNLLNVWLSVAVLCALLDVTLTLLGGERYTLGWYSARILSVGAGALVLGTTLWEINRVYAQLSHTNRRLADLASHDGLTGVRNRRHFDEVLELQVRRARTSASPLALLIFDVDFFKRYNDTFGHQSGDAALVRVAQALRDSARGDLDTVCRYGGEEFVVLCPDCDARGVLVISDRMREAVMALDIPAPPNPEGRTRLTVSAGAAVFGPKGADSGKRLLEQADQALYLAKRQGRNRTVLFEPSRETATL